MRAIALLALLMISSVAVAQEITGFGNGPASPQEPGYHKLVYHYSDEGKPREMSFLLYLPESYSAAATQPATQPTTQPAEGYPMLVFMSGLGERGSDPSMLRAGGIPRDLTTRPEVLAWLPMIMVGPQCPADSRYEDDHIGKAITAIIDEISVRYPVDPQRRYITGFSMGGTGCWSVARFARERLAVVAPMVPRVFQPELLSEALAGTGTTCLVVSGEADPKSEPGSGEMVTALRGRGVDVVYAMIPKGDHNLWTYYYRDRRFYEWLMSHRQGQPKPAGRMGEADFIEMAKERITHNESFFAKLESDLQTIAPWWHIDNCAMRDNQGLRARVNGRQNVFVTIPYYLEAPCRLQTTATLPKAADVKLQLVVGRHRQGNWKLIVRVNEQEVFASPIDSETAPDLWKTVEVDLTAWASQQVRLQVCQEGIQGLKNADAYWQTIKIVP